jgi:hypothetical protein
LSTERKSEPKAHLRPRPFRLKVHSWLRWLHTYISMFSLLAILFFSITGVTLNHPDWAFTNTESKAETKGQFPTGWKKGETVDWFLISEHLRQNGVRGTAKDKEADESEGSISFKAPGYSADCFFDSQTGKYDLSVTTSGFTGMMNDFHRGKDAGSAWSWMIDISGITLALVASTGLGLLWYLKKVRTAGFLLLGTGALLIVIAMKLAF